MKLKGINFLRISMAVLYIFTSIFNLYMALTDPGQLKGLADTALIGLYRLFALNASETIWMLSLLVFSVYQLGMAILLLSRSRNVRIGAVAGIVFHLGILPWGWWSMSNLLFVVVHIMILRNEYEKTAVDIIKDCIKS